jgi:hypothetical protein
MRRGQRPVRPVPWVPRLRLRPEPALRKKLGRVSRFTAMAEEEVASAILSRVESARTCFRHFMPPRPPTSATWARPPAGQGLAGLEVRVSRRLVDRLNDFAERSGLTPEQIACLILKDCEMSHLEQRALLELQEQRNRDLEIEVVPGRPYPATTSG